MNPARVEPEQARRVALITGASSGIGEAFAHVFAAEGFNLILSARREDRLTIVQAQLQERYGIRAEVIVDDLSDRAAPARICAAIDARGLKVDALVNNAGYGVPGSYLSKPWSTHEAFLQVMVTAVADLTYRLLPGMIERQYGRIINVASLAAFVPSPAGHTMYAASKAFMVKFTESLAGEVRRDGVFVSALCPGFTFSEFHDVTGTREQMKSLPPWMWMSAADVARRGYDAVMAGDPIVIPGRVNTAIAALVRIVPLSIVVGVGRRLGKSYRKQ